MLQLQYITRLKNKHINNILDNYKLKYSGMKNEIDTKINELIKLFLKDILAFLENLEQTATNKKKINNYDKMKTELESIRNQLKIKTYNEHKAKNELDLLAQENSLLKVKIKSLNQKIFNLNNNNNNIINNNERNSKSPLIKHKLKSLRSADLSSKSLLNNNIINITSEANNKKHSYSVNKKMKSDKNLVEKINKLSIAKKTDKSKLKEEYNQTERNKKSNLKEYIQKSHIVNNNNNKKNKKINYNKFVNNKKNSDINISNSLKDSNSTNNNIKEYKKSNNELTSRPILKAMSNIIKEQNYGRRNSSSSSSSTPKERDIHNYSPNNSFELLNPINQDYEEIGNNINSVFDEELKQLEQDEENIKRLLEQLKNGKVNGFRIVNKSIDNKLEKEIN